MFQKSLIGVLALAAVAGAQPGGDGAPGRGGPGARLIGAEVGMPGRVVRNAAFSAEIVTERSQALPDGNRIKQTSAVRFYRDSEGRTRREQSLQNLNGLAPNSTLPQVAFINDPVASTSYALDLGQRTATKSAWGRGGGGRMQQGASGSEPRPMGRFGQGPGGGPPPEGGPRPMTRARNNPNLKTESLGRQTVEGVQAEGSRTTLTIPAGEVGNELPIQVVTETWYSPDLQIAVLRKRSDPRSGDSLTRYTNISRTEPSRVLFEPPADFKVTESRRPQPRQ